MNLFVQVAFFLALLRQNNCFVKLHEVLEETYGTPTICTFFGPNQMVDTFMINSVQFLKGPIKLPIINEPSLSLTLYDGHVYGLENLWRTGDADTGCIGDWVVSRSSFNTTKPTRANYSWRFGLFGGEVNVVVGNLIVDMTLTMHLLQGQKFNSPKINVINVKELNGVSVKLGGLSALNTKLSWISSFIVNTLGAQISRLVNPLLLDFANNEIMPRLANYSSL